MSDNLISFAAGMVYGFTSTVVGQPLDTVKTRMQARPSEMSKGTLKALTDLWSKEGFRGLYRGAAPLFVGGGLMRSAQFGCYDIAYRTITTREGRDPEAPPPRVLGVFNPEVIAAGFCGGLGRAVVEAPADYIKTRRQVDRPWSLRDMTNSSVGITMLRNSFLFMSFSVYTDLSKQIVPGGLPPFLQGAICANLAWLTVWPADVVKSRMQSGNFAGQGMASVLADVWRSGAIFRGVLPGLARSTIANGSAMWMYKRTQAMLEERFGRGRESTF